MLGSDTSVIHHNIRTRAGELLSIPYGGPAARRVQLRGSCRRGAGGGSRDEGLPRRRCFDESDLLTPRCWRFVFPWSGACAGGDRGGGGGNGGAGASASSLGDRITPDALRRSRSRRVPAPRVPAMPHPARPPPRPRGPRPHSPAPRTPLRPAPPGLERGEVNAVTVALARGVPLGASCAAGCADHNHQYGIQEGGKGRCWCRWYVSLLT